MLFGMAEVVVVEPQFLVFDDAIELRGVVIALFVLFVALVAGFE